MQVNKNKSSSKLLLVYTNGMFNVQLGVLSSKSITSQTFFFPLKTRTHSHSKSHNSTLNSRQRYYVEVCPWVALENRAL